MPTEEPLHYAHIIIEVTRGGVVESNHRVCAAVRTAQGAGDLTFGNPRASSFWRSAFKPFQALAVVEDGADRAFGLDSKDLAVVCASHGGTEEHIAHVERMLAAIGERPAALYCGPHTPYDAHAADVLSRSGRQPGSLHNNCSGKHASMLALATHHSWDTDGYWRYDHPVQARVRQLMPDWIEADPETLNWATDGCGVPTPFVGLATMATAYARLATRAAETGSPSAVVVDAMTRHPELTSSAGREPLSIMLATAGRLLAKEGAEGVLCVAATDEKWGLALKVEDGARRAVGPAAVEILSRAGLLRPGERDALRDLAEVPIRSTLNERVGGVRPRAGTQTDPGDE